jgi:capsular exopolysaccharide synthesis family protein
VAFIIDLWDDSIYSLTQLKKITIKPVLGVISKQKKYNFLSLNKEDNYPSFEKISNYPQDKSNSYLGNESFRNLYINLRLLQDENNVNSIVISSFNSHVENVNISVNLAKTVATLGRKVLLIDANLTNPQIHQLLELENQYGLTDILAEKIELFSAIQKVPQEDNLSVITVGKLTNNLSYLFFYPTLKKTIDDLVNSQLFDLIIYDTSCILDFADAKMIASYTDGIVLALKMGKTKAREVQKAIDELDIAQISLLGLVQA